MKLNRDFPVYLFDTSGLLDFALERSPGHTQLIGMLDSKGQYRYHPITLAELADYLHEEIWQSRQKNRSPAQIKEGIRRRRLLIPKLYVHRKKDDPVTYLHGRRFLPFSVSFEAFSLIAHQRSDPKYLRKMSGDRITVVADMTDHQILGAAFFLKRSKYEVKFVSGDKDLLSAAERLGVPYIYSKKPEYMIPFTWIGWP